MEKCDLVTMKKTNNDNNNTKYIFYNILLLYTMCDVY